MFKLLATTGMRRQELIDLTWEQIDFYNETILIFGKVKKERLLPLHTMMLPLLENIKNRYRSTRRIQKSLYFEIIMGRLLPPQGLQFIFKDVLKKAGLPPHRFTLHHFWHTFATLLLQQGKIEAVDEQGMYQPSNKKRLISGLYKNY